MESFNLKEYGIDVGLLISGLFGSILLTSKNSAKNLGKTVSSLIGGAASANYITPIVISLTNVDETHYHYGIAFLLGFLGLKGIEYFSSKLLPDTEAIEEPVTQETSNTKTKVVRRKRFNK